MSGYVHGKHVAVVGNASSIIGRGHGALIDRCDLVIRMNRGLPFDPTSQGTRTDILAFSVFPHVEDICSKFKAKHLIWMSPKLRETENKNFHYYSLERWEALYNKLRGRPSVGAMVLDLIADHHPENVSIFGYDFKRSCTIYQEHQHIGPHNYNSEEGFCNELAESRKWNVYRDY